MIDWIDEDGRRVLVQNLRTEQMLGVSFIPVPAALLRPAPPSNSGSPRPERGEPLADPRGSVSREYPPAGARGSERAQGRGTEARSSAPPRPAPVSRDPLPPPPLDAPWRQGGADVEGKRQQLAVLDEQSVKGCVKCGLARTRTNTVFGQGNAAARLVFVGEAPGADEDAQGLAFVGRAGQLLTQMIGAMKLSRDDVFICNVLKCRPPNNREPAPEEIRCCSPYLFEQIGIIQPEVIVALGAPASRTLLNTDESIGRLRGRFHPFYPSGVSGQGATIPLMPTYHPAYLLRNPPDKVKAWSDLKLVMEKLGIPWA